MSQYLIPVSLSASFLLPASNSIGEYVPWKVCLSGILSINAPAMPQYSPCPLLPIYITAPAHL